MEHNGDIVSALNGVCDVSYRIEDKVSSVLYVETHLNIVNAF